MENACKTTNQRSWMATGLKIKKESGPKASCEAEPQRCQQVHPSTAMQIPRMKHGWDVNSKHRVVRHYTLTQWRWEREEKATHVHSSHKFFSSRLPWTVCRGSGVTRLRSVSLCSAARTMNVNFWELVWIHVSAVGKGRGGVAESFCQSTTRIDCVWHPRWPLLCNFRKMQVSEIWDKLYEEVRKIIQTP